MTPIKLYILVALVILSLLTTAFGGIQDILGLQGTLVSKEHAWNDGQVLLMLAILVAIAMK